ncbi:MAG: macro domain-containing protein [Candidatus Levyibacteriota bacterium]|nr:MAG: macro domain-containing protein [Candidatus Levybacteria bacterium]
MFKHESKQSLIKNIFEKAGKDLVKEVTTIGYCEVGYAVMTKGYELKAKHVIFMPIADHNNEESRINYVGLHQSLRSAFTLADLYNAKSVAIAGIRIPGKRKDFLKSLWDKFLGDSSEMKSLGGDEIEDIIITTSKNLEKNSIKNLFIYKYSK